MPTRRPIAALISTSIAIQLLLVVVLFVSNALDFMLKLDTALSLIPYLLAAGYALKLTITRETYTAADEPERRKQRLIAALAIAYSVLPLYSAGVEYLLLAYIVYARNPAVPRREQRKRAFNSAEALVCAGLGDGRSGRRRGDLNGRVGDLSRGQRCCNAASIR